VASIALQPPTLSQPADHGGVDGLLLGHHATDQVGEEDLVGGGQGHVLHVAVEAVLANSRMTVSTPAEETSIW
jgi:hypothetical protein